MVPLYIASPPCTLFSSAGKGTGRDALGILADAIHRIFAGEDCRAEVRQRVYDEITLPARTVENTARSHAKQWSVEKIEKAAHADAFTACLVLEPARRILELDPQRIAMEQVPEVLPLWRVYGACLRARGYATWTGVLCAADYGVPQTRRRAIFMASRVSTVQPPAPTHAQHPQDADLFGGQLAPWVSMATALGWGFDDEPAATVSSGGAATGGPEPFANANYRKRLHAVAVDRRTNSKGPRGTMVPSALVTIDRPSPTITGSARLWVLRMGNQANACQRRLDEPAPTVLFGHASNKVEWIHQRPATTIVGSFKPEIVSPPGYRTTESRQNAEGGVKITVAEGGVLQSFPRDYPWTGSKSKCFEQVGNAIPPLLAAHILSALTGIALRLEMAA